MNQISRIALVLIPILCGLPSAALAKDEKLEVCIPLTNLPGSKEEVVFIPPSDASGTRMRPRYAGKQTDVRSRNNASRETYEWRRTFAGWPGFSDSSTETVISIELPIGLEAEGELNLGDSSNAKVELIRINPGMRRSKIGSAVTGTISYTSLVLGDHENEVTRALIETIRNAADIQEGLLIRMDAEIVFPIRPDQDFEKDVHRCLLDVTFILNKDAKAVK